MNKVEYCRFILNQLVDEINYLNKHSHSKEIAITENCPFCLPVIEEHKVIAFNCNRLEKLYEFKEQISNQIVQYNIREKLNTPQAKISAPE